MYAYEYASLKDIMSCKDIEVNTKPKSLDKVNPIYKLQVEPSSTRKAVPSFKSPPEYSFVYPTLKCSDCDKIGIYSTISYASDDFYKNAWIVGIGGIMTRSDHFALCCITIPITKFIYTWTQHYPRNS